MTKTTVVATIEYTDGHVEYKTYSATNKTITWLKKRIRERHSGPDVAHVGLGNGIYQHSYGAH